MTQDDSATRDTAGETDPRVVVERLLASLPRRRAHTLAVGGEARRVAVLAATEARADLVTAAYLHDIGYAPAATDTGAHQLDGARLLRRMGYGDRVCRLVAHHTGAVHEARVRHLETYLLREFPEPDPTLLALLTYCDLSTGPTGDPVSVEDRLVDIFDRYGPAHVVSRAMRAAEPDLLATVTAVRDQLREAGSTFR